MNFNNFTIINGDKMKKITLNNEKNKTLKKKIFLSGHLIIFALIILVINSCSDGKTANENLESGISDYQGKDYNSALNEFTLSIKKSGSNSNAFYYKAISEVQLQKKQDALLSFQKAIQLDSANYLAFVERAKLKIILGDYVSAINDCEKAKSLKKEYSEIYKTKASAFEFLNDHANALIEYEFAIAYDENNGETYFKIGLLYLNQGNKELACGNLRKAGDLGFMESFELIKTNCNDVSTKSKSSENGLKQKENSKEKLKDLPSIKNSIYGETENPLNLKLGDNFSEWERYFSYKGERPSMGKNYVCKEKLNSLVCDHQIDKLSVNVKNGKIVSHILILIPKQSETGVPGALIKKIKTEAGVDLVYKSGTYGASNGKMIVSLFRKDDPSMGGDRIVIYTTLQD